MGSLWYFFSQLGFREGQSVGLFAQRVREHWGTPQRKRSGVWCVLKDRWIWRSVLWMPLSDVVLALLWLFFTQTARGRSSGTRGSQEVR